MTPDMNNDPLVLLALAATAWAMLGLQSWRARRPRKTERPDVRKTSTWRNRWH